MRTLRIAAEWSQEHEIDGELFMVSFDLRPRVAVGDTTDVELLRIGSDFFRSLLIEFVRNRGQIRFHTNEGFGRCNGWPRLISSELEVQEAIRLLLLPQDASPYPLVVWFDPNRSKSLEATTDDELREAALDLETLHELIREGRPRLFLDDSWGGILASPSDRFWVRRWIEEAVRIAPQTVVELDFSVSDA